MKKLFPVFFMLWLHQLAFCQIPPQQAPRIIASGQEIEEAWERQEAKEFLKQNKKDELKKITENSFFDKSLSPLPGKPVLLAAGIQFWKDIRGNRDTEPDMVKFEIVSGKGSLEFFTAYDLRITNLAAPRRQIQTSTNGPYALAWLLTDPDMPEEVIVKATFLAAGQRAAFIDPKSVVFFSVKTIEPPLGFNPADVAQLKRDEFTNSLKPCQFLLDHYGFTYPTFNGMLPHEQKAIFYNSSKTIIFIKNDEGIVREAPAMEEKKEYQKSRQEWRFLPPDFTGLVTHVDSQGKSFGVATYSHYNHDWVFMGKDQFEPGHWNFSQYNAESLNAGPEISRQLNTLQDEPYGPVRAELSLIQNSHLMSRNNFCYWKTTTSWIYAPYDFNIIYRLEIFNKSEIQAGSALSLASLAALLRKKQPKVELPLEKPCEDFKSKLGFSFQDFTNKINEQYPKYGYPNGAVVSAVGWESSAASLGLLHGDIVVLADGELIENARTFQAFLIGRDSTKPLTLVYWREGIYYQVVITFK